MFCKRPVSDGPTEKDAILHDFHTAAFSKDEKGREKHDIQNQVVRNVDFYKHGINVILQ
jgi:hypothetical protein